MAAAKPANQKLQRTEPAYVPALAMILSFKIPKGYRGKVRILPDRHEVAKSRKVFVAAIVLSAPKANPHPDRESSESLSNREFRGLARRFSQPMAKHIEHSRPSRFVPFASNARTYFDAQIAQMASGVTPIRP